MVNRKTVAVIGGGVAGIGAAAHLAELGSVLLLEREDALGFHASGRSAAMFEEDYGPAPIKSLSQASRAFFVTPGAARDSYLSPRGLMLVARADQRAGFEADLAELDLQEIPVSEALARVPILNPDSVAFVVNDAATTEIYTDDFERSAGSTIGNGWIEQTNDSRIYDTAQPATKMLISVTAGTPFAVVNQLTNTFVAGERYELVWNGSRAAAANGTLIYDVSIGTWDGTTFTPLATEAGSIANVNLFGKTAGPSVYFTASGAEAGQPIAVRFEVVTGSSDWAGFDDISVNALGANTAPTFAADPFNKADATEDAAYSATISADASDADVGDTLSYSKLTGPSWLSIAADGSLSGTPANNDVGLNAFTVRVTDAGGLSADATMNITVINTNDAPVANDNSGSIAEDATIGTAVVTVSATDVDAGDTLSYAITAGNTGGAFA
uniref:FAD-dependent oxidoreductase n=1 Tax=Pseudophaeobacter arcticus TaxID=385492 RepID=UPI002493B0AB